MCKYSKVTIALLLILFQFSCRKETIRDSIHTELETIVYNSEKSKAIDNLIKNKEYILLDTSVDEALLRHTSNIKIKDGYIYVLDVLSRKLIAFNEDGSFAKTISKQGQGPEEYATISDYDIDNNGNVYLYDGNKKTILLFNRKNKFVKSLKVPFYSHSIKVLPNGNILFGLASTNEGLAKGYRVALTDASLNLLEKYIPYDEYVDHTFIIDSKFHDSAHNQITYYKGIDDYVYLFNQEGKLTKSIKFDFSNYTVPKQYRTNIQKFYASYSKNHQFLDSSPLQLKNYLFGSVSDKGKASIFVYDINDKNIYKRRRNPFDMVPQVCINDSTYAYTIQEFSEYNFPADSGFTDEQIAHLKEGGSIICKCTL